MTITEFLAMPKGMSLEEYEKLLEDKLRLEEQIKKVSNDIDFANDSLEVLADEVGSNKYNKQLLNKQKAKAKMEKLQNKLNHIKAKL